VLGSAARSHTLLEWCTLWVQRGRGVDVVYCLLVSRVGCGADRGGIVVVFDVHRDCLYVRFYTTELWHSLRVCSRLRYMNETSNLCPFLTSMSRRLEGRPRSVKPLFPRIASLQDNWGGVELLRERARRYFLAEVCREYVYKSLLAYHGSPYDVIHRYI
jgi:hypothetical protein